MFEINLEMKSFASDNYAGVLPEVMEALIKANEQHAISYGNDIITERTNLLFKEVFGHDVSVFFVFNGTGANVLSIVNAAQSFQSVICADTSHIYCDESSAPETITGCRFFPIPANDLGQLTPELISQRIIRKGDIHYANAALVSITQSTEYGTVYSLEQLKEIGLLAKKQELFYHIDGARFFNAAASVGCSLKEMSTDIGVDILSLGGTKIGMMYGEAVVVFNKKLAEYMRFRQKQVMQLASKTRFIAAQFEAILSNDLWLKPANHANNMAHYLYQNLNKITGIAITKPVHANAVFATLNPHIIPLLQAQFPFYVWNEHTHEVRLMCSFDTTKDEIDLFIKAIHQITE